MNRYSKKDYPKEYRAWLAMKARCYAPSTTKGYYKENNIQVCERWLHSFDNFMDDMGKCPDRYSLDRIDNLKDYSPDNCRWASWDTQARNKSNSRIFTHDGKTMCLRDWATYLDINYYTLNKRINAYGYSFEDAIAENFGRVNKNNTSGHKGVSWNKSKERWQAYGADGKGGLIHLGTFKEYDEAVKAREQWEHENTTPTKAK